MSFLHYSIMALWLKVIAFCTKIQYSFMTAIGFFRFTILSIFVQFCSLFYTLLNLLLYFCLYSSSYDYLIINFPNTYFFICVTLTKYLIIIRYTFQYNYHFHFLHILQLIVLNTTDWLINIRRKIVFYQFLVCIEPKITLLVWAWK